MAMKTKSGIIFYIIVFAILSINIADGQEKKEINNNLKFELSVQKNTFIEAEPIIIRVSALNIGNKRDSVKKYFRISTTDKDLILKGKNSGIADRKGIMTTAHFPYVILNPGDTISYEFDLLSKFGSTIIVSDSVPAEYDYYLLEADKYNLKYSYGYDNLNAFHSNIDFEIKKPDGIDSIICFELMNFYKMRVLNYNNTHKIYTPIEKYNYILDLIIKYPPNTYTEKFYDLYNAWRAVLGVKDSLIEKNLWFIKNYPNSYYIDWIVYHTLNVAYKFNSGESSSEEIIDFIINEVPNTRAANLANEYRMSKNFQKVILKFFIVE
jgi:hypothetical protein